MNELKLTSKEVLEKLEESMEDYDEFDRCDVANLEKITKDFIVDGYNAYVTVADGMLVIPYGHDYCSDTYEVYSVLYLEDAFMSHDKPDSIAKIINAHKEIISLLESK